MRKSCKCLVEQSNMKARWSSGLSKAKNLIPWEDNERDAEGTNITWKMFTCVQSESYMCDERHLRAIWKEQ